MAVVLYIININIIITRMVMASSVQLAKLSVEYMHHVTYVAIAKALKKTNRPPTDRQIDRQTDRQLWSPNAHCNM